ncbi:MAG TPA: carboxypeptidase regulatory-like domain-containing protein [Gammaproteobacteria bacterium]|nr:carboxypeptidase regulatory-like domain-containing protein [Gammaproteobacteria bacterium]
MRIYTLLFILASFSFAVMSAELIIKVTDENEPVAMAEIVLINAKTRLVINNDFTDKSGVYRFSVKPGQYKVIVSKETFSDVTIKNIIMNNKRISKSVELIPSAFNEDNPSSDDCD